MTKDDIIKSIPVNEANFLNIAEYKRINGSLLVSLRDAMEDYSTQQTAAIQKELIETRAAWKKDRDDLQVKRLSVEKELSDFKALVKHMRDRQNVISIPMDEQAAHWTSLSRIEQQVDKILGL